MKKMLPHHPKVMELGTMGVMERRGREEGNPFSGGPSISALSKSTENRFVATRSKWEREVKETSDLVTQDNMTIVV